MRNTLLHRNDDLETAGPSHKVSAATRRSELATDAGTRSGPAIWEAASLDRDEPSTSSVMHAGQRQLSPDVEQSLISIVMRPLRESESHHTGNENREQEVRALFAELSPLDALLLRRRLDANRTEDPVVIAFRRLVVDRRQRLYGYLADPRRGAI
ncbi:MAG TPA: hypothetical protein VMZ53_05340 [Kofleriaceae bacterium]|nr:hypothetical protein [Kofleriaceae bacterium]